MDDQQDPTPDPPNTTDVISAVASVVAGVISVITLLTVYVAARQLLTEHKAYEAGLSLQALGPWQSKVKTKKLFGLQQTVATPVISVAFLVKKGWQPEFSYPNGFQLFSSPQTNPPVNHGKDQSWWKTTLSRMLRRQPKDNSDDAHPLLETEKALPSATWVTFLQALGIKPEDEQFYALSPQSALVNGTIPMRWEGKDLCAAACMLGFYCYEEKLNLRLPMKLPAQWFGPLGWLQFRQNDDGCVVEFRRRAKRDNQLSELVHQYYRKIPKHHEPHFLKARLWWTAQGLLLKRGQPLFIGPATDGKQGNIELLVPSLGLLAADEESCELASSRGLDTRTLFQYTRRYVDSLSPQEEDLYQYKLGKKRMDSLVVAQFKDALELLKPDGYYFTPSGTTYLELLSVFDTVNAPFISLQQTKSMVFRLTYSDVWPPHYKHAEELFFAMEVCNEFQSVMLASQGTQPFFTPEDMMAMAKASQSLRQIYQRLPDLSWAMLICPQLFNDLAEYFEHHLYLDELDGTVICENELLDCTSILKGHLRKGEDGVTSAEPFKYHTPLCEDGIYTGWEVLAAFADLIIQYFWVIRSVVVTNAGSYGMVIPQTITMV